MKMLRFDLRGEEVDHMAGVRGQRHRYQFVSFELKVLKMGRKVLLSFEVDMD